MWAFLYCDAVFYAAGQEEQVRQLRAFVLRLNLFLYGLQLPPEPLNQLQGSALCEVLLCVLAQRNLGRKDSKRTQTK